MFIAIVVFAGLTLLLVSILIGRYRFGKVLQRAESDNFGSGVLEPCSEVSYPTHVETLRWKDRNRL